MSYWKTREQAHIEQMKLREINYKREIKKRYQLILDSIQNEIDTFFSTYAGKENISLEEARKRVSEFDVQRFSSKAKRYVQTRDFSSEANRQLRIYNTTMKINRLEALKAKIGLDLLALQDDIEKYTRSTLQTEALEEIQRQAGILGVEFTNRETFIKRVIDTSFQGASFSDRIWAHQTALKAEIDRLLSQGLVKGAHPTVLARELREMFGVSQRQAERLMITESARVQGDVQAEGYKQAGYRLYEFIAESTACEACSELNGRVFKIETRVVGENFYPMHPYCRCSSVPYQEEGEKVEK